MKLERYTQTYELEVDSKGGASPQRADQNIGKIKNQINSAIFYLQKSLVADSDTKYYVFDYEASSGPG